MKRLLIYVFTLMAFSACSQNNKISPKLECVITSLQDTILLGNEHELRLSIKGLDKVLLENKESKIIRSEAITDMKFYVKPQTIGKHIYGPYKVKINGQKIVSNKISITVVRPEEFNNRVYIYSPDTAVVGSLLDLVFISTDGEFDLELKESENFRTVSTSKVTSSTINNGEDSAEYKIRFRLELLESGELLINEDMFKHLSSSVKIQNKKIVIMRNNG